MKLALGSLVVFLAVAGAAGLETPQSAGGQVRLEDAYELSPTEGVYAYSRVSPDGRFLAYASEPSSRASQEPGRKYRLVRVINLSTGRAEFEEPGVDAYWSVEGTRVIFASEVAAEPTVSVWYQSGGHVTRGVAPLILGDYFSWALRGERDLIMTIDANYYFLDGGRAVLPSKYLEDCPKIGRGDRPLISKDGRQASVFANGRVAVRNVDNCHDVIDTGIVGAKADFSWDGRYLAFHAPKQTGGGYAIRIVDLWKRTVRVLEIPAASCLFPSWTRDGRLLFRCDGDRHRFVLASNVLSLKETPTPRTPEQVAPPEQADLGLPTSERRIAILVVWAPWSAHSVEALEAVRQSNPLAQDIDAYGAADPWSDTSDIERHSRVAASILTNVRLSPTQFRSTGAMNQVPSVLAFVDGRLVERRLGAQSVDSLRSLYVALRQRLK